MKGNGWVLRNLERYGNSLLPDELIHTLNDDIELTRRLIEYAYEKPVVIRESTSGFIVWDDR